MCFVYQANSRFAGITPTSTCTCNPRLYWDVFRHQNTFVFFSYCFFVIPIVPLRIVLDEEGSFWNSFSQQAMSSCSEVPLEKYQSSIEATSTGLWGNHLNVTHSPHALSASSMALVVNLLLDEGLPTLSGSWELFDHTSPPWSVQVGEGEQHAHWSVEV